MICPQCKAEYIDGMVICMDCRVELVEDGEIMEASNPKAISVRGNTLECPVCGGGFFIKTTPAESANPAVLGLAPEGRSISSYICNDCGYIYWFADTPKTFNNRFIQPNQSGIPAFESDDETTTVSRDECPMCFQPIRLRDKECSYCGYRLEG